MADFRDIDVNTFNGTGISIDVGHDPKADNFFTFIFGEDLFEKILMETNRYARQKLAKEEAFFLQNGTTKGMWRFCPQMFHQMSRLELSNEYKMDSLCTTAPPPKKIGKERL